MVRTTIPFDDATDLLRLPRGQIGKSEQHRDHQYRTVAHHHHSDQSVRGLSVHCTDTQGFLSQLAETNNQLDDTLLAPANASERKSAILVQRLAQLRLQFMQSQLRTTLAIRRILTPEQLGKVSEAMNEMKRDGTSQLEPDSRSF